MHFHLNVFVYVAQISMISVMKWIVQVPDVLSPTVAVHLELCWDQTDKRAWVRQTQGKEADRGQISCATDKDKQEHVNTLEMVSEKQSNWIFSMFTSCFKGYIKNIHVIFLFT